MRGLKKAFFELFILQAMHEINMALPLSNISGSPSVFIQFECIHMKLKKIIDPKTVNGLC